MPGLFDLEDGAAYTRWRDAKLAAAPADASELVVEVGDPRALTKAEHAALAARIDRCNMAIYASPQRQADVALPARLGQQFGLEELDANWLSDDSGISSIRVSDNGTRTHYIPYTDKPIKWHTDGYYNPPERTIRAMVLHCVHPAAEGGANRLMDHELAYLLLRERDPVHIRALMQPNAMTIPERVDETDGVRPAQTGPVFSVDATGHLHMRYTARTRSIEWKDDAATRAAVSALEQILADESSGHIFNLTLEAGMGVICNNVLHDRSAFKDLPDSPRLLYRARYLQRIRDG